MKISAVIISITITAICFSFGIQQKKSYNNLYSSSLTAFDDKLGKLAATVSAADVNSEEGKARIQEEIARTRLSLKSLDFWFRYFEPVVYRRINGPLPVEWENEVFEKFEPPYRREGAGLTLAANYLEEGNISRDSLLSLVNSARSSLATFRADSIAGQLDNHHHFFLANRLYLLNLAALYTTGFECPDTSAVIPELRSMAADVKFIYQRFQETFPSTPVSATYMEGYDRLIAFVNSQPAGFSAFDHFKFIRDFVNPLFRMNQEFIVRYGVVTKNYNDYSLNNDCLSIFDKGLYAPQNTKGIFSLVEDESLLEEVRATGKLLFYDPVLSANNSRSCASCHKPTQFFTDTTQRTAFQFDHEKFLDRNTPSLVNAIYNHLIMLDGKHISLQDQAKEVMHNITEMNLSEKELIKKVMSCKEYKDAFKKFLKYTPEEKEVSMSHIVSAITYYYAGFSSYASPFDEAMNNKATPDAAVVRGFNLFMSKAQCGTCHFVPMFNGIKPPYIGSEFEVIGVPDDTAYTKLSPDKGRYLVNPAAETMNAFRTGTVRNTALTKPYMHNGVFNTLEEVIELYNVGGGAGKKIHVPNQTLSSDSLHLTASEKKDLIAFIHALNEKVIFDTEPPTLPPSGDKKINARKVGGEY